MEKTQKWKSIRLSALAYQQISYLCKVTNMKRSSLLSELIDQMFEIGGVYKSLNISYTIFGENLNIEFSGKSRIVTGSFESSTNAKDSETDSRIIKESKKKLEKANKA